MQSYVFKFIFLIILSVQCYSVDANGKNYIFLIVNIGIINPNKHRYISLFIRTTNRLTNTTLTLI